MTSETRFKTILSKLALSHKNRSPSDRATDDKIAITIDAVKADVLSLHDEYRGYSESLSRRVESLTERVSTLYPTLLAVHKGYVDSSHQVGVLSKDNTRLTAALANAHEEIATKDSQITELSHRVESLVQDNGELNERLLAAEGSVDDFRSLQDELESSLGQERRKVAQLEDRQNELTARLAKRDAEYFDAQNKVARLTNDLAEAKLALESKQVMLDRLAESAAEEQAARAKAESLLSQSNARVDSLSEEIRTQTRESANVAKRYENEIEQLKVECREQRLKREGLQSRINVLDRLLASQRVKERQVNRHVTQVQIAMRQILAGKADQAALDAAAEQIDLPAPDDEADAPDEASLESEVTAGELDVAGTAENGHVVQLRPKVAEAGSS